jgi:ABC-type sugar transport system substrate-binding protein
MNGTTTPRGNLVRCLAGLSAAALAAGALAACGSSDSDSTSSQASAATGTGASTSGAGKSFSIQFVNPLPNYPTWKLIGDCIHKEADKLGASYTESGPSGQTIDATQMIQQIQQAVANKKGAVITFPNSDGFAPALKQAQDKGVVTGTIYGTGDADSGADYNIGPDWNAIGDANMSAVAALPGKHVVGLVAADNTGLGKAWLDGVKNAAKKYPNVTIAGEVYTGDDAAKALPQVNALLTAHPEITDIVTHMGTTTPGAVAAIKSHNRQGKTFLVAIGHDNGGTEAVKSGASRLVFLQDVCTLGKQMTDGVVAVHEGKTPAPAPVKVKVIPADQLDQYLKQGWV